MNTRLITAMLIFGAVVIGGIMLIKKGNEPERVIPSDPLSFSPAFATSSDLDASVGCPNYSRKVLETTKGVFEHISDGQLHPTRSIEISVAEMDELRKHLSNHLSYGLEYASIKKLEFRLRLSGLSGDLVLLVADGGVEFCIEEAFGSRHESLWFSSSGNLINAFTRTLYRQHTES